MLPAYYNENDPHAAAWLRNLVAAGLIPSGDVDERSISDVRPDDLVGYGQCHFFAGVGGWALAARLAGWPDDRPIWTGSCPCQPFSVAGKGKAQTDDRHLWPDFFRLIRSCRPAVVMGEQVAAAVGKDWLDGVFDDLEGIGYACEAAIAPACAVNAPHRRDRLWFVGRSRVLDHCIGARLEGYAGDGDNAPGRSVEDRPAAATGRGSDVADRAGDGCEQGQSAPASARYGGVAAAAGCAGGTVSDADTSRSFPGSFSGIHRSEESTGARHVEPVGHRAAWDDANWIIGHDGKARRVGTGVRMLAHGVSGRVAVERPGEQPDITETHWYNRAGALRAFGNAIVPQEAAEVIGAFMDCYPEDA